MYMNELLKRVYFNNRGCCFFYNKNKLKTYIYYLCLAIFNVYSLFY